MNQWHILEEAFPWFDYAYKETVFTIGNGYFSSRGSFEEGYPGESATTFVHGVFNKVPIFKTELVNFPKWYAAKLLFDGEPFRLDTGQILTFQRELNMANGLLARRVTWQSPRGKQVHIQFERIMDMSQVHHAVMRLKLFPVNFSGNVQIEFPLPGTVSNERYRHWKHLSQGRLRESGCYLELKTLDSDIRTGIAQWTSVNQDQILAPYAFWDAEWVPTVVYQVPVQEGDVITATKHVAVYTSRDIINPVEQANRTAVEYSKQDFNTAVEESQRTWQNLWDRSNVTIAGDELADRALRYNLFQILIAAPRHCDTVSIGAKTLSGYGYRGHVFWDTEIFVLPFLIYTQPAIARNLLMYRFHTLPGARKKAADNGFKGAMYAWESADTGEEVTPTWVTDENDRLIRIWCGDIEQHITADVAYGIDQYWKATGDDAFMRDFGAEMVLSAAMFYASRLEWDKKDSLYHLRDVIGPDEYHEHVDDNAMTNLMCTRCLQLAQEVANWLRENYPQGYEILLEKLNLNHVEIQSWEKMQKNIAIKVRTDGVIEQFEGYFDLQYIDLASLEPRQESLQRLFGIEGVQEYQFIKQPDVVMALYLLKASFSNTNILKNMTFYTPRTDLTQGSSLGPSIQALMLARYGDINEAKELLFKTLLTDLNNNRGNTPDGIHAASAGAVWQVILFGFLGFEVQAGQPHISPRLPAGWEQIKLKIMLKNQEISFDIK